MKSLQSLSVLLLMLGSFGGGLALLIIGSIGFALDKSRRTDRADS